MAYNDPVLQRAMFQKQGQAMAPAVGLGGGLGSMTTPDENAKQLRSMFAPTVDLSMPSQMLGQPQQPVQSFQEGGPVAPVPIDEVESQYVKERSGGSQLSRDISSIISPQPDEQAAAEGARRMAEMQTGFAAQKRLLEEAERIRKEREAASPGSPLGDYFRDLTPEQLRAREAARVAAVDAARRQGATVAETYTRDVAGRPGGVASLSVAQMLANDRAQENPLALTRPSQQAPAAAPAREKGALELTLDGIREERARSAEDKKQNALLALMQAGFAMAAGRSPNAISNIGAGGQAGIAAFAQLERARREDASALRRDELAVRLAQAKMAEDPETVKLFKALGGGDLMKGFELYNSDKKLQAAAVLFKEPLASDEAKKDAERYIQSQIAKARGAGGYPGFSATAVPTR